MSGRFVFGFGGLFVMGGLFIAGTHMTWGMAGSMFLEGGVIGYLMYLGSRVPESQ